MLYTIDGDIGTKVNLFPADAWRWSNAGSLLAHRMWRWPNINLVMGHPLVFAEVDVIFMLS